MILMVKGLKLCFYVNGLPYVVVYVVRPMGRGGRAWCRPSDHRYRGLPGRLNPNKPDGLDPLVACDLGANGY